MDKPSYRVRNWAEYNKSLVKRGSLTFWFDKESINQWQSGQKSGKRGRPEEYSDMAIQVSLTLRALYKLTFRATEGFVKGLIELLQLRLEAPNYTLLCKRQKTIALDLPKKGMQQGENLNLVFDSTGLKIYGEGEWKVRQYGWKKRRVWRKLHLAVNAKNQQIEAFELTHLGLQDCEGFSLLLNQIKDPIESSIGDGAYDRYSCYEEAERRNFKLITPPQRNAKLSTEMQKKKVNPDALQKRDLAIKQVRDLGRKEWKIQSGYHRRSLAETGMFRVKTLLGKQLRARTLENQKAEIAIWCQIINKMTTLGMPKSMPIT